MCHKEVFHQFQDRDYQRIDSHQHQDSFDAMKLYSPALKHGSADCIKTTTAKNDPFENFFTWLSIKFDHI